MTMLPADCAAVTTSRGTPAPSSLQKFLRVLSVGTMMMTVPQVLAVWVGRNAEGASLLSWAAYLFSACLWFVYGLQKRDRTIYLACIGWIAFDAAIITGVVVHR
jgi:Sugar efflux transporter for intercellular exchange